MSFQMSSFLVSSGFRSSDWYANKVYCWHRLWKLANAFSDKKYYLLKRAWTYILLFAGVIFWMFECINHGSSLDHGVWCEKQVYAWYSLIYIVVKKKFLSSIKLQPPQCWHYALSGMVRVGLWLDEYVDAICLLGHGVQHSMCSPVDLVMMSLNCNRLRPCRCHCGEGGDSTIWKSKAFAYCTRKRWFKSSLQSRPTLIAPSATGIQWCESWSSYLWQSYLR